MPLKILIAIDKFKGSLTSIEAAEAVRDGILCGLFSSSKLPPHFEIVPIADGGDGSADVVSFIWGEEAESVRCMARDPLGRLIESGYIIRRERDGGVTAFIEMAKISGLVLLSPQERDPLKTTTYGLGELVNDAIGRGATNIYLSIGGSATNDGGAGMLQALGYNFYLSSESGCKAVGEYMSGEKVGQIEKITPPALTLAERGISLNIICDVTNPLLGPNGATYVYGKQKGADENALKLLEQGLEHYSLLFDNWADRGSNGAGAAGGVGFAGMVLGGKIIKGWEFFVNLTKLPDHIKRADLVISGEGKIDTQSLSGKLIDGVASLCKSYSKPLLLLCGRSELASEELSEKLGLGGIKIFSLSDKEPDLETSMKNGASLLREVASEAMLHF